MIKCKLITSLGLFLISILSFGQQETFMDSKLYQDKIEYPYFASEPRKKIIFENMNELKLDMNKDEVIKLLTLPDEINPTYTSIKTSNTIIGFSMVYLLKRKRETGSVNEKEEQLIRIHFNNEGIVIWAYSAGIDEFNTIEKTK